MNNSQQVYQPKIKETTPDKVVLEFATEDGMSVQTALTKEEFIAFVKVINKVYFEQFG